MHPSQLSEGSSYWHTPVSHEAQAETRLHLTREASGTGYGVSRNNDSAGSESDADRQPERPNLYSVSIYESGTHLPLKSKA